MEMAAGSHVNQEIIRLLAEGGDELCAPNIAAVAVVFYKGGIDAIKHDGNVVADAASVDGDDNLVIVVKWTVLAEGLAEAAGEWLESLPVIQDQWEDNQCSHGSFLSTVTSVSFLFPPWHTIKTSTISMPFFFPIPTVFHPNEMQC